MKTITVRDKISKKERKYTQLTSLEDINSLIDDDIEFSETKEVINDIIAQRGIRNQNKDEVDSLLHMYKFINRELDKDSTTFEFGDVGSITINGFNENRLTTKREPILEMKREGMIEVLDKYGEIWLNKVGGYCPPLKGFEII